MLEIIWRLRAEVLTDEAELRTLISAVVQLPGMNATQYDLNRKGQWRRYDLQHIVVDALTQRTQLLVIRAQEATGGDDASSAQAMIALGKHGEQPTVIIQLAESDAVTHRVIEACSDLYETMELESTFVMSQRRRAAMARAQLDLPAISGARAMAWDPGRVPPGIRALGPASLVDTPMSVRRHATHWLVDFGQASIEAAEAAKGTAYRAALEGLNACLLEG